MIFSCTEHGFSLREMFAIFFADIACQKTVLGFRKLKFIFCYWRFIFHLLKKVVFREGRINFSQGKMYFCKDKMNFHK